jgi:hypothetical protein
MTKRMDGIAHEKPHDETDQQKNLISMKGPLSSTIPSESLKDVMTLSNSISQYIKQNQFIFKQADEMVRVLPSFDTGLISEMTKIADIQLRLKDSVRTVSQVFENASAANKSLEKIFASTNVKQLQEIFAQITERSDAWKDQMRTLDVMAENLRHFELVWQSQLIEASRFSILSEMTLSRI